MTDLTTLKEVLNNQLKYSGGDHPITANRLIALIERAEKCQQVKDETKSAEKLFTKEEAMAFARYVVLMKTDYTVNCNDRIDYEYCLNLWMKL